jgi:hypothetical protein
VNRETGNPICASRLRGCWPGAEPRTSSSPRLPRHSGCRERHLGQNSGVMSVLCPGTDRLSLVPESATAVMEGAGTTAVLTCVASVTCPHPGPGSSTGVADPPLWPARAGNTGLGREAQRDPGAVFTPGHGGHGSTRRILQDRRRRGIPMNSDSRAEPASGFVVAAGEGQPFWFLNTLTINKVGSAGSQGRLSVVDHRVPPGFAPPRTYIWKARRRSSSSTVSLKGSAETRHGAPGPARWCTCRAGSARL